MRIPWLRRRGPTRTDPVCGMEVEIDRPGGGSLEHGGTAYYFCAPGCNRAFGREPEAYLSGEKRLEM